jgi:hypothetical protein
MSLVDWETVWKQFSKGKGIAPPALPHSNDARIALQNLSPCFARCADTLLSKPPFA